MFGGITYKANYFFKFFLNILSNMCKKRMERDIPSEARKNKNLNIGLLNLSNEKMGDGIDSSDIVIYVIAAIC